MFRVKVHDHETCYLHGDPVNGWRLKMNKRTAYVFATRKTAERAYKEFHKSREGKNLHVPVSTLTRVEIEPV